jgi:PAS domain S-box-containing protein
MVSKLDTLTSFRKGFYAKLSESLHQARHNDEETQYEYEKQLKENAARYFAIVDTAVDAIIVVDRFGQVESFNHSAEKIFGYAAEEVIGKNIKQLMPEPYQSHHDGYLATYRATGERKIIGIGREVEGRRKDGSIVPLELSIAEWHDVNGRQCFTGIMRDVTLRNQQANELQAAKEAAELARMEAEAANLAKTEFLAVMSHEIRTPLTSISGFVDLLSRSQNLNREQQRYIELVRTANSALLTIVNDILDFSKVEAGQLELESRAFETSGLINDIISIVRPIAAGKNLCLSYDIDDDVPTWLLGDDSRIRQILLNLLNNAVKFTPTGSVGVKLRRRSQEPTDHHVWFSVTDTGIGIPVEHQHRLFKQFSQADSSISRRHGGTGLGLAICKRLVELMDGEIGILSEPGKGTTLWFTARLPKSSLPTNTAPNDLVPLSAHETHARILLVDDLETNQEIVRAFLEDAGYQVSAASNGPEAIERVQAEPFDLVLMDIQMPVMDGVTATKCIRALDNPIRNIPIIAMTGNVLPQQVRTFLNSGMNDHVCKPIERPKLYEKVWRWLPQRKNIASAVTPENRNLTFNHEKFNELIFALSAQRVQKTALKFFEQLDACFDGSRDSAFNEAHDLINPAGLLGFEALVELCQQLQALPRSNPAEIDGAIAALRIAKRRCLELLQEVLLPELAQLTMRDTG